MGNVLRDKEVWANLAIVGTALSGYFTGTLDLGTALSMAVVALMNAIAEAIKEYNAAKAPVA